jgi:Transposase domain (DUF772)
LTHGKRASVRAANEGKSPIEGYLNEGFAIELAMGRVRAYKKSTGRLPKIMTADTVTHRLFAFAAMLARVYERLPAPAQTALAGRVRGGLKDDNGLASVMEQLECNLLFRRFVGVSMDGAAWDATVFCKNRDRVLDGDIARKVHALFSILLGHRSTTVRVHFSRLSEI